MVRRLRLRDRSIGLLLVLPLFVGSAPAAALAGNSRDTETEVDFLLSFARYVEWPEQRDKGRSSAITLCVLRGGLPYRMARDAARNRKVAGRRIAVRSIARVAEGHDCHILFLPETQKALHDDAIRALSSQSVFTVAESGDFAAQGGVANFMQVNGKIRFAINREAARRAGLKISSRLLRVARIVD